MKPATVLVPDDNGALRPIQVCSECGGRFSDEDTGAPSTPQQAHLAEESLAVSRLRADRLASHLELTTSMLKESQASAARLRIERDDLERQLAALAGLSVWPRGARLADYFIARSETMADSSGPRSSAIARHLAAYHVRDKLNHPEVWLLGVARDAWRDRTALLNEVATLRSKVERAEAQRDEAIAREGGPQP